MQQSRLPAAGWWKERARSPPTTTAIAIGYDICCEGPGSGEQARPFVGGDPLRSTAS